MGQFQELNEQGLLPLDLSADVYTVETVNDVVRGATVGAGRQVTPIGTQARMRKAVPWWTEQCRDAVKSMNGPFRMLKRLYNYQ